MRNVVMMITVIINFVMQTTLFHNLKVYNVFPNTSLIIITCYALLCGSKHSLFVAWFVGFLFDTFFSMNYGLYTLPLVMISFFIGKFQEDFYRENYLLPVLFCLLSSFLYELYFLLCEFVFRGSFHIVFFVSDVVIPTSIYTVFLTVPIYRILFSINEHFEMKERYKYKRYF